MNAVNCSIALVLPLNTKLVILYH